MKKRLPILSFLILGLIPITSCGGGGSKVIEEGATIYQEKLIYEAGIKTDEEDTENKTEATKETFTFYELKEEKKVKAINWGRIKAESGEYFTVGKILGLSSKFLSKVSTGEQKITVEFKDDSFEIVNAFIATKVIKTAEDFQNINEDLQGYYVLGNDIDLSSIANFEPLGYFFGDETNPNNSYFHGILEGNGHTVKNAKVYYSNSPSNNFDVYNKVGGFKSDAHRAGDNIGLFQIIGSSGVVRNVKFSNIDVRGRTIVGVIAGNNSGTIENCIIDDQCSAIMDTHFYDNDCNTGAVAGIVAASGSIRNTVSLTSSITVTGIYTDYDDKYKGEIGNGWDHSSEKGNTDNTWKFCGVDRKVMDYSDPDNPVGKETNEQDSNGSNSNGIYAFAGKTWGTIESSYALQFDITPHEGTARPVNFTQTHLGTLKPTSGDDEMGTVTSSGCLTAEELKSASKYTTFDNTVWKIEEGSLPSLVSDSFVKSYTFSLKK